MLVTLRITANNACFSKFVTHEGWEYCILERDLGAHLDSQQNMLVALRFTANSACLSKSYDQKQCITVGIVSLP